MLKKTVTNNYRQTQQLGKKIGEEIAKKEAGKKALILYLKGNLGGGKTTFLQGLAKGLGIKEKILSPTFVISKKFKLKNLQFQSFYHLDCYRLKSRKDILDLDFRNIISDPKNIVAIEWPEKILKTIPKKAIMITLKFVDNNKREVKISGLN